MGPLAGGHAPAGAGLQQRCGGHLLDSRGAVLRQHEALEGGETRTTASCFRCSTSPRRSILVSTSLIGSAQSCSSEGYPNGPGRPDRRSRCSRRGFASHRKSGSTSSTPGSWTTGGAEDPQAAADWFLRGIQAVHGAPNWLRPLAASVLAEGGDHTGRARSCGRSWRRPRNRSGCVELRGPHCSSSMPRRSSTSFSRSSTASTTKRADSRPDGLRWSARASSGDSARSDGSRLRPRSGVGGR